MSKPSAVRGAAPNVDLTERDRREVYEKDVDENRVIEAECLRCGKSKTLYMEAGRSRAWEHDLETDASHFVEYRRIERETTQSGNAGDTQ